MLKIRIDGCAIPNPGIVSIAVVIFWGDEPVRKYAKIVGEGTNNFGEYAACIEALKIAKEMNHKKVEIQSDSQLLINQLNGKYKVKAENLIPLHKTILNMKREFDEVNFVWIPREENYIADCLAYNILRYKLNQKGE